MIQTTTGADKQRSYSGDYKRAGQHAEEIVLAFLRERPDIIGVDDLRDLRVMRETDVDCTIKTADGRVTLAEIKSDAHLGVSGNVLFEVLRINHTCISERACTLGWAARSPATYFLYYAPMVNSIYQCRAGALRTVFQHYSRQQRSKTVLHWVDTDAIKSTLNALIPWSWCKSIFTIHQLR